MTSESKIFALGAAAILAGTCVAPFFCGNAAAARDCGGFGEGTRRALVEEIGVRAGDLVLRRGNGLWSDFICGKNPRDGRFSHIGILAGEGADFFVVHADCNSAGQGSVRKEPLADFLRESRRVGVFRLRERDGADCARRAEAFLGLPFDWKFDLDDAGAIYCTELIFRAVSGAAGTARETDFAAGTIDVGGRRILSVDAFTSAEVAEQLFDSGDAE